MKEKWILYTGKQEEILPASFPDNYFGSLVTDGPYGLKFMAQHWDYQVPSIAEWKEIYRVMKPGAYGVNFCGTRTQHRMAVNLEDAGFEIRDIIPWVYGSGMVKSMNLGKQFPEGSPEAEQWEGWGTGLKPAVELITLFRKPLIGRTIDNLQVHGVGGLNIDACRVPPTGESLDGGDVKYRGKKKSVSEGWDRPWMSDEDALKARAERGTASQVKGETLGRFPANFIHDGSEEVLELFPHGTGAAAPVNPGYSGKSSGIYGDFAQKGGSTYIGDVGSAARFFYCAKPSPSERNAGTSEKNDHTTVKPLKLMRYLVKLITPPGEIVLDPYAGSGTTGAACVMEGFQCVMIDKEESHAATIQERVLHWEKEAAKGVQQKLF